VQERPALKISNSGDDDEFARRVSRAAASLASRAVFAVKLYRRRAIGLGCLNVEECAMTLRLSGAVAAVLFVTVSPAPAQTATASEPTIVLAQETEAPARRPRTKKEGVSSKQLTPKQLATQERQRKCSSEWKSGKSAGTIEKGVTWPKFWSQCNTRLKGNSA
jgi:hypothetical protein